jgi:DNA-binding NtrC family response regulator
VTGRVQGFDSAAPVTAAAGEGGESSGSSGNVSMWRPLPSGKMIPVFRLPKQGTSLEEIERSLVVLAVRQAEGNQTAAAKMLDISRDALRYKLKKFGFEVDGE